MVPESGKKSWAKKRNGDTINTRTAGDRKSPHCTYKDNLVCITQYVINVARDKTDIFLRYVHAHFSHQPFNTFSWNFFWKKSFGHMKQQEMETQPLSCFAALA